MAAQQPSASRSNQGGNAAKDDVNEDRASHYVADETSDKKSGNSRGSEQGKNRESLRNPDLPGAEGKRRKYDSQYDIDSGDHSRLRDK